MYFAFYSHVKLFVTLKSKIDFRNLLILTFHYFNNDNELSHRSKCDISLI